jgi:hypothetical protein
MQVIYKGREEELLQLAAKDQLILVLLNRSVVATSVNKE